LWTEVTLHPGSEQQPGGGLKGYLDKQIRSMEGYRPTCCLTFLFYISIAYDKVTSERNLTNPKKNLSLYL